LGVAAGKKGLPFLPGHSGLFLNRYVEES